MPQLNKGGKFVFGLSGIFDNPYMIWGRYRKRWFRYELPLSFRFHHTQMDGAHAGKFLANLQKEVDRLYR